MNRVKGKTIIVTGGAVGIGRAISLILAQEGAKVAVTDLQDEAGRKVVEEITKAGGSAAFWHMDVSNESEVKRMFAQIVGKFGGIDVLVNNAGISGTDKPTHEITCEEWDQVMAVNVKGVFLCTREALLTMRESGGGSIINLSSIYGIVGAPDLPVYHASKGAVRMMTKTDALLYAKEKIRVNSVHPGFIWTPLVEDLGERSDEGVEKFRENLDSLHPIGHVGVPEDIAWGVVYLASDESKFVTGSELVIDGGYTAR
ncbi:MAG: glucose 1-dehydrogenase [Verrucomicrobiales bacterium]|jgi:NAD(P)-dependent dehydrogenase (short-subunit alcohol dehydrogenase family)|nr:glucose 1-dehydrogenase [Verrucomicrobiales bacterium]